MRTWICIIVFFAATSLAQADVGLYGNLVIKDTYVGAEIMGEVFNDTDMNVTDVEIRVIARDGSGNIIDEPSGWVDGYTDPESGFDDYIPAGEIVPFHFYADVEADDIVTYEYSVLYEETDALIPDYGSISLSGDFVMVSNSLGASFYGEIANLSSNYVYDVDVVLAVKNADGDVIDVDNSYVVGKNYLSYGTIHTGTLIPPSYKSPFHIMTTIDTEEFDSYNMVINYDTGPTEYSYYGESEVVVTGSISTMDLLNNVKYTGEIENGSDCDIYFTSISIISRNANGSIIDICKTYVDGTDFEIPGGTTTDTHISTGMTAPFEVHSDAPTSSMETFEYIIHYQYDPESVFVEKNTPLAFTLDQNYPNPFNPATTITFMLPDASDVTLDVYNANGQHVAELVNSPLTAGQHNVTWNAAHLPSGVYFYTLTANGQAKRGKMMLVK